MLQTTAMSVNEVDSGALTSVQLCIVLEDVLQGLERDVVITLTTTVGTAGRHASYYVQYSHMGVY